jgi:diguanylate cyclase (GGDEF)-like protein
MRGDIWRAVVDGGSSPVVLVAPDSTVRYANPAAGRSLGVFAIGLRFAASFPPEEQPRVEAWLAELRSSVPGSAVFLEVTTDAGGVERRFELLARNLLEDPVVEAIVVNGVDITARWNLVRDLADRALRDPLTGLANRALFADRLAQAHIAGPIALLFVDLDAFKRVNNEYGHAVGDELLRAIGGRLQREIRGTATVARLGGDEFVILLPGAAVEEARTVASRVQAAVSAPVDTAAGPVSVGSSIGIATGEGAFTSEDILRHADAAMYQAKARGRGGVVVYEPELTQAERLRFATLHDLDELRRRNAELQAAAGTDPLLGIPNLRRYDQRLAEIDADARRTGRLYSIVFCDVDHFGRYNKTWGEQAGDEALRTVARVLVEASRRDDEVFRRGGEELVVVLPDTPLAAATIAAERLRAAVEAIELPTGGSATISAGVATFDPTRHATASDVEADADRAMNAAKRAGRNRVTQA